MNRKYAALAASVAALTLGACADSTSPNAATPGASAVQNVQFNSTRHIFHTKQFYAKSNPARPSRSTGISYHGGPLIVNPSVTKVVAIYWSTAQIYASAPTNSHGTGSGDGSLIGSFLRNLGGSKYFNINTTYYNGSTAHVLNSVTYSGYWATGSSVAGPSASPTDADMAALIQAGFGNGSLTYDPNTVYAIFTGPGINLGGGFGSQYCAYHTHATINGQTVLYAAMPHNQDYVSGCTSQFASPNSDVAANSEVNTLAHEIEETTTDELGSAWYDNRGYENADKCAWTWGSTYPATGGTANMQLSDGKFYLIQQNWINSGSGGCTLG